MQKRRFWSYVLPVLLAVLVPLLGAGTAMAVTSSSSNYKVTETQFTSGTSVQSCSGSYCAKVSIGDAAVGNAASTDNSAKFGSITNSDPLLEVIVEAGQSNLGTLTAETTATKTTVIKIRNYLSDGYVLQVVGDPPKFAGHTLSTSETPVQSVPGTEQFGINAVANTNPTVGANLVQVPDAQTSFGIVYNSYNSPNLFMFKSGDNIAHSTKSSGETDYTISMIVNISSGTPAGHYSGDFSAIVIPFY
ncbi:MAG TPA: hypothetical protein VIM31_04895 [Candidatus Microsaccharimonas sp.]|jgi:hypothetical protein